MEDKQGNVTEWVLIVLIAAFVDHHPPVKETCPVCLFYYHRFEKTDTDRESGILQMPASIPHPSYTMISLITLLDGVEYPSGGGCISASLLWRDTPA